MRMCNKAIIETCLYTAKTKIKLEIWGKAQRESARRPKSDRGKLEEK